MLKNKTNPGVSPEIRRIQAEVNARANNKISKLLKEAEELNRQADQIEEATEFVVKVCGIILLLVLIFIGITN